MQASDGATEVDDLTEAEDEEIGRDVRYSLTSYGADYPVDSLVKRIREESLFVPPFQREFVWKRPQASRFVESLLMGLPVPGIFLARELGETQRVMVVDGQQRLWSLSRFYEGIWEDEVFTLKGVSSRFEGKTYKELSTEERRGLDDSIIHATIVKQDRPEEDDSSIYLIFERINTTATLLTPQEIRSTVSRGKFNQLLHRLNENVHWREIYGPVNLRLKDQELILRFLCLYNDLERYHRPMKDTLNKFMHRNRNLTVVTEDAICKVFEPTVEVVLNSLGRRPFRPVRALNAAVFDAVMVGIAKRVTSGIPDRNAVRAGYQRLLRDPAFIQAYTRSTSDDEQVRRRVELAIAAFDKT